MGRGGRDGVWRPGNPATWHGQAHGDGIARDSAGSQSIASPRLALAAYRTVPFRWRACVREGVCACVCVFVYKRVVVVSLCPSPHWHLGPASRTADPARPSQSSWQLYSGVKASGQAEQAPSFLTTSYGLCRGSADHGRDGAPQDVRSLPTASVGWGARGSLARIPYERAGRASSGI